MYSLTSLKNFLRAEAQKIPVVHVYTQTIFFLYVAVKKFGASFNDLSRVRYMSCRNGIRSSGIVEESNITNS